MNNDYSILISEEDADYAAKMFPKEFGIDGKFLKEAIRDKLRPQKKSSLPKIIRRFKLPSILGLSLREIDRLIHPIKEKNKIIAPAQLPSVKIGKKAIGVLEKDLLHFIEIRRSGGLDEQDER